MRYWREILLLFVILSIDPQGTLAFRNPVVPQFAVPMLGGEVATPTPGSSGSSGLPRLHKPVGPATPGGNPPTGATPGGDEAPFGVDIGWIQWLRVVFLG